MSAFVRVGLLLVAMGAIHVACAMSPEERLATEKAWEERDRERAEECVRAGGRYFASTCLWGPAR